jgi:hypothetical protein
MWAPPDVGWLLPRGPRDSVSPGKSERINHASLQTLFKPSSTTYLEQTGMALPDLTIVLVYSSYCAPCSSFSVAHPCHWRLYVPLNHDR